MSASLVGSEMCIRDSWTADAARLIGPGGVPVALRRRCLVQEARAEQDIAVPANWGPAPPKPLPLVQGPEAWQDAARQRMVGYVGPT
eukprot:14735251-Alexandrium_andersonii.AAC.1